MNAQGLPLGEKRRMHMGVIDGNMVLALGQHATMALNGATKATANNPP